ncbi:hypothetical protein KSP40_PGU006365 [Platanthera guangdongensis]|uniref:Uncharacterized protein n=1 Tax=Platanthera guangdongensis TaxID=2320717 RepID=A0ABR2N0B6_9ASPA
MGSEGPPLVTVNVTGFKKIHGVSENPTETILSNLRGFMERMGLPKALILGSCSVLDTAGEGAVEHLNTLLKFALSGQDNQFSNSGKIIWVGYTFTTP